MLLFDLVATISYYGPLCVGRVFELGNFNQWLAVKNWGLLSWVECILHCDMTTPYGFQGIEYDGLNKGDLYRIIHLNACCPICGTPWKGQGGTVLWEDTSLLGMF